MGARFDGSRHDPARAARSWAGPVTGSTRRTPWTRRLLASVLGRRSGLSGLSVVPKRLTWPLRRDGVDPVPALGRLREEDPVSRLSRILGMNVWLVTGHEQARAVLSDTTSYSTDIRSRLGNGAEQSIGGLGFTDPPEHTRLRKLLTPEFTGRRLAALRPRIEQLVDDQLDLLAARDGVIDLVEDFAFPIPFLVICELLGLPVEDRDRFRRLGHARFNITGGGPGTLGAMSESRTFLLEAVRKQREHPGDGLIGALIRGGDVDDNELAGLADGVFTGGYETSASMLALGTLSLLRDPDAFALVRAGGEAADAVVEELLRHLSVVQISFPRFARQDMELFGKTVKAGDVVVCSLAGANRDAAFGPSPDRFDPYRAARSHLAFGHGFHRCIGAALARMELQVAFQALTSRFPDMVLAVDPGALQFRELSIVYGVESLPVRLTLGATRCGSTT
jgi:cytochrome P450